jgi:hypothetical protein
MSRCRAVQLLSVWPGTFALVPTKSPRLQLPMRLITRENQAAPQVSVCCSKAVPALQGVRCDLTVGAIDSTEGGWAGP